MSRLRAGASWPSQPVSTEPVRILHTHFLIFLSRYLLFILFPSPLPLPLAYPGKYKNKMTTPMDSNDVDVSFVYTIVAFIRTVWSYGLNSVLL